MGPRAGMRGVRSGRPELGPGTYLLGARGRDGLTPPQSKDILPGDRTVSNGEPCAPEVALIIRALPTELPARQLLLEAVEVPAVREPTA